MAWIEKRGAKYRVCWYSDQQNKIRKVLSFDSFAEADAFHKKLEYQQNIGIIFDPVRISFGEYLDHWLDIHGANLESKTLTSYQCEIKNHIKPSLGEVKLLKLTPMMLQSYYKDAVREGRVNAIRNSKAKNAEKRIKKLKEEGKTGLSNTTVRYHHRIIHKAIGQAVKWQMVGHNIADAVEPPRAEPPVIDYLRKEQIPLLLETIKNREDYPVILAAIFTGARQGELLGLKWKDVDFDHGLIHIRHQMQYLPSDGYFIKNPKQNSQRTIPMLLQVNSGLRIQQKRQNRYKKVYGNEYHENDLVFCNPNGSPMDGSGLTKRFQRMLAECDLPKISFHSLRHTFATMCRGAGMAIEDIQDLLGHASISTTKEMYMHIEVEPLQKAMEKLRDYIPME